MEITREARTTAPPDRAWRVLAAPGDYPRWTASMSEVTALDGDGLAVGRRFRIRQPGLPAAVWHVTEVREGEGFTWESRSPGVRTVASHRLAAAAEA